jgi:hypothetical protein
MCVPAESVIASIAVSAAAAACCLVCDNKVYMACPCRKRFDVPAVIAAAAACCQVEEKKANIVGVKALSDAERAQLRAAKKAAHA